MGNFFFLKAVSWEVRVTGNLSAKLSRNKVRTKEENPRHSAKRRGGEVRTELHFRPRFIHKRMGPREHHPWDRSGWPSAHVWRKPDL
ncbi:hypothetical protein NPIL_477191 [Nephila pilipes]|uniref:Uncharacterized protein n=1 Tax=Nephila pilipes TaxID=299642 RepID=A0A8X6U308_NEPPI|nr:hypothetical protein NPIL_477191 [Nephila pilipes]